MGELSSSGVNNHEPASGTDSVLRGMAHRTPCSSEAALTAPQTQPLRSGLPHTHRGPCSSERIPESGISRGTLEGVALWVAQL